MAGKHMVKTEKSKKKFSFTKGKLLTIVALIEIFAIAIVAVSAWVETISSIKVAGSGQIDTYVLTNANIDQSDNIINLGSYFKEAGNVHLASASSANGRDIYFPKNPAAAISGYRKGTINDKNVNYISYTFKIKAVDSAATMYLNSVPQIEVDGEKVTGNDFRFAITIDDTTKVYSNTASNLNVVGGTSSSDLVAENVLAFSDYLYNTGAKNPLFSVPKNTEKEITISLWLQDESASSRYTGKSVNINEFTLVTSAFLPIEISFFDGTTKTASADYDGWQWASKDSNIWMYTASNGKFYQMSYSSSNNKWMGTLPSSSFRASNKNLTFYSFPNTVSNPTTSTTYNCKWNTTISESQTEYLYSAYGNANSSKVGMGVWGKVIQIEMNSDNTGILQNKVAQTVTMKNTNGQSIPMSFSKGNDSSATAKYRAFTPENYANSLDFIFSGHTVKADKRNNSVEYVVTSASTGYWKPPARVTVYADVNKGTASVTGGVSGATDVYVTAGTDVTISQTPKTGYEFDGWFTDAAFTTPATAVGNDGKFNAATQNAHYQFYAKYTQIHDVSLTAVSDNVVGNAGGNVRIDVNNVIGTAGATANKTIRHGSKVVINAIPNEGYDFVGWYATADGDTVLVSDSPHTFASIDQPYTLYAKFKIKEFTIKAVAKEGGQVQFTAPNQTSPGTVVQIQNVKYGSEAVFVALPNDASGYEFVGWFDNEGCTGTAVGTAPTYAKTIKAETTLYAKFQLKKYTFTVKAVTGTALSTTGGQVMVKNGTLGASAAGLITHGTGTLTFTAQEKTGYTFEGWYTSTAGSSLISTSILASGSTPTSKTITVTNVKADTTIYAKFKAITFTVKAVATGSNQGTVKFTAPTTTGSSSSAQVSVEYNKSATFVATGADGYVFEGWYNDAACTSKVSGASSTYSVTITADKTLYAKFVLKEYTVTLNAGTGGTVKVANGTAGASASGKITHGSNGSLQITAIPDTANGYTFAGWYTNSDCTTALASSNIKTGVQTDATITLTNITANTTLYAKFNRSTVTTTIYFETRSGYQTSYNVWAYSVAGSHYSGDTWPGDAAELDSFTQLYKYTFSTSDTGTFKVIVSDNGSSQYPASSGDHSGLEGTIGKTYLFKSGSPSELEEYTPVAPPVVTDVTITLVDKLGWLGNNSANIYLYDYNTGTSYLTTKNGNNYTASIPSTVTSVDVYRCSGSFSTSSYWNRWIDLGNRGTKTTLTLSSGSGQSNSGGGTWS